MGIEPTQSAWKAEILPLNYTRTNADSSIIANIIPVVKRFFEKSLNFSCFLYYFLFLQRFEYFFKISIDRNKSLVL